MSVDQSCVILECPWESGVLRLAPIANRSISNDRSQIASEAHVVVCRCRCREHRTGRSRHDHVPRSSSSPAPGRSRPETGTHSRKAVGEAHCCTPGAGTKPPKQDAKILFQTYFKSVGPADDAAQLKQAGNGNHFLVFTEGSGDHKTGDLRKISLFLFSEDFENFFRLMCGTQVFASCQEVQQQRQKFWAKQSKQSLKGA